MKTIAVLLFSLLAFNTSASELEDRVRSVEVDHNAKCSQVHRSMNICFGKVQGLPGYCFWSVSFDCASNTGDFILKVKMKQSNGRNPQVRKDIISIIEE